MDADAARLSACRLTFVIYIFKVTLHMATKDKKGNDMQNAETFGIAAPQDTAAEFDLVHVDMWQEWCAAASDEMRNWIDAQNFSGRAGSALVFPGPDGRMQKAVGLYGKHAVWDGAGLAKSLPRGIWAATQTTGATPGDTDIEQLALGWALSQYSFNRYQPEKDNNDRPNLLKLPDTVNTSRLLGLIEGTWLCRNLINTPANHMTPQQLEEAATTLASRFDASIRITSGNTLATDYPAIHTVGRAAEVPPRLIDISWGKTGPNITLVGKGITFDTGGLDLKPSKAMEMMKKDMGGAATVLGLALAIMTAKLPVRLRVLVAAAENAVSDRAMRPLDVIDTRAGLKVEVGNTDAEGRLVLADALTLAGESENDFIIDFATLTGAARVALGTELPALFCNHDDTAAALIEASNEAADPLWRLPLFDDYERHLDNGFAAMSSTGSSGYGGAITAALFLRRFAGRQANWAHIDVMAWNLASRPGRPKGGEAMGLRAVYRYIEKLANA